MPILSPDEISTIFVVGFPPDIRDREFQNLFMFASGFEGASLKVPEPNSADSTSSEPRYDDCHANSDGSSNCSANGIQSKQGPMFKQQTIGFARFQRRQDALAARDHLNGRCIDLERGCVLKVEMAKKNLFIAPRKQSIHSCIPLRDDAASDDCPDEIMAPIIKTTRSLSLSIPGNPAPIDITIPGSLFPKSNEKPYSEQPSQSELIAGGNGRSFSLSGSAAGSPPMYILGENPPCNTLYVGNLPLNADEEELRVLFSTCDGYRRLSYKNKPNGPMCFVEFDDIPCARKAMDALYGTLLSSSTKGGIRLSFSKNPLGVRSTPPNDTVAPMTGRPVNMAAVEVSEEAPVPIRPLNYSYYEPTRPSSDLSSYIGGQVFKVL